MEHNRDQNQKNSGLGGRNRGRKGEGSGQEECRKGAQKAWMLHALPAALGPLGGARWALGGLAGCLEATCSLPPSVAGCLQLRHRACAAGLCLQSWTFGPCCYLWATTSILLRPAPPCPALPRPAPQPLRLTDDLVVRAANPATLVPAGHQIAAEDPKPLFSKLSDELIVELRAR